MLGKMIEIALGIEKKHVEYLNRKRNYQGLNPRSLRKNRNRTEDETSEKYALLIQHEPLGSMRPVTIYQLEMYM